MIKILLTLILLVSSTFATTWNASTCSQTDVQNTINAGSTVAGDTVVVPSGTCTYTTTSISTPSVTINKAITVQGATTCTGRASTLACTNNTTIQDATGSGFGEMVFSLTVSNARLTGITLRDDRIGTITNVAITSNVVTLTVANSYFAAGVSPQNVAVSGLTTATFLNGQQLTIVSRTSSQITANFTHANYSSTVDSGTLTIVDYKQHIGTLKNTTGWRVDHSNMVSTNGTGDGIQCGGFGLVDHVIAVNFDTAFPVYGEDSRDATYPGDYSWTQPLALGSASEVYIEDSELDDSAAVLNGQDDYSGARVVFRYNDVKGTNVGSHGLDSGGLRSVMLMDVNNNTISNAGTHIQSLFVTRGGTFLVWQNNVSASGGSFDNFLDLRNYRGDPACGSECGSFGVCTGSNSIDQNTASSGGYRCRDQVASSYETAPAGDWPVVTSSPAYSESFLPAYSWGNTYKGAAPTNANTFICGYPCVGNTNVTTNQIINNRDYYMEVPSFNGTAGTGSGLLSARPATCSPIVGYWATDTNTLYKCLTTNTWTAYYTPYTYPNPLQGAGVSQPVTPSGAAILAAK